MPRAFSMHEYQRVVATEGRISGSWHVNLGSREDSDVWIEAHDVTIYDETRRSGRVFYGSDLTARIHKGEPEISIVRRDLQYEVDEVRDELLRLLPAIAVAAREGSAVEVAESPGQEE